MDRRAFVKSVSASALASALPVRLHGAQPRASAAEHSSVLSRARIFIDWSAASGSGCVPNRNDPREPTRNRIAFPTGPIVNESGAPAPVHTPYYGKVADPSGTSHGATRIVTTAHQTFFFYRTETCPAMPAGAYGLRFRLRASPGTGPHAFEFGLSTQYVKGHASDLDWASPHDEAATTFSVEFQYEGEGDIAIRFAGPADCLIDRIQLYPGGLKAIAAWREEAIVGARTAFAFPGSFAHNARGNWIIAAGSAGAWIYEPGLEARSYEAITVMHVGSLDALPRQSLATALSVPADAELGTKRDATIFLGWEATVPDYAGELRMRPAKSFRSHTGINLLGAGIHIQGQVLDASGARMYFWEIPVYSERSAFQPMRVNRWLVGSGANTARAWQPQAEAPGEHVCTLVWDSALSQEDWEEACAGVREAFADRGLAKVPEFHLFSGDSNATRATGDWTQLVTSAGYFAPARDLWASNTSVGGQRTSSLEGPAGRWAVTDSPILLASAKGARATLYHYLMGTNDWQDLATHGVEAYVRRVQAILSSSLALHPGISVMYHTILPRGDEQSLSAGFEPHRRDANARMRAWIAAQDSRRVRLCDFGDNPTIGDAARTAEYMIHDAIHLNRAGDREAAAICAAAVRAWRFDNALQTRTGNT
ncbi:MAG TPA: SGNH/GDSL hydrolase family protein [Usitatibacter sp.]|jgi:hypothetical protein|nr:SGNH/GDSL hydrolase family protein [Usitatibacter sp.]